MKLVDAHFHLDLHKDPAAIIAECEAKTVYTIAVTNAPSVFSHTQLLAKPTQYVRAAVGLHPELAGTHGRELPQLLALIEQTRYVGEVGLDYCTNDEALRSAQRRIFEATLSRCAELGDKIITVHSRRSATDVLARVGNSFPGTIILHWFSGSKRDLLAGLEAGCYFSVNPAMLKSKHGRSLIQEMPRSKVLTETDGPFVEVDGRRAIPTDARKAVEGIAEIWKVEPAEAAAQIFSNFRSIIARGDSAVRG